MARLSVVGFEELVDLEPVVLVLVLDLEDVTGGSVDLDLLGRAALLCHGYFPDGTVLLFERCALGRSADVVSGGLHRPFLRNVGISGISLGAGRGDGRPDTTQQYDDGGDGEELFSVHDFRRGKGRDGFEGYGTRV